MGRLTGSWERPIQGVSQQADSDRIDGQCTKQENFIPSPLYGLIKRIGTRYINKLMDSVSVDSLWYEYNRGGLERYLIVIEPNSFPRVFDTNGTERVVNEGTLSESYLKVTNPSDSLVLKTIADYTFIVNKEVVTKAGTSVQPTNPNTAIVYCQFATYGRDYKIIIDGVEVASYTTPDGSESSHVNYVKTNYIATTLNDQIKNTYTTELHSNTIFITKHDNSSFSIDTEDSSDGNDLIAVQDTVLQVSNLPPYAPTNYIVKIQNNEGYDANSFWLKATVDSNEQTGSTVKWVETLAPDEILGFDLTTMPHQMVSNEDGSFTLSKGEWENREVGNEDTNPLPSFLDSAISSVATFQNRMVFTSQEAAIFGRTNNFFNFFRETTQTEIDSDPIDVFSDTDEINNLLHNAVLDGDIIFFSQNGQFIIKGDKPITKETVILSKVTSYPMNVKAAPATTGESVMFSFTAGKYAGVREMFTDSYTDTKRARPITEHVAEYIKGVPTRIVTSPNINTMLIQTTDDSKIVYVYDWLWSGDNKIQAAFHKWVFTGDVLFAKFIIDELYMVIKRPEGVFLEVIPISNDEDDNGLDFPLRLDQRITVTANWTGARWEWTVPYEADTDNMEFIRGEGCWKDDHGTSVVFETDGTIFWSYDDLADWKDAGIISCTLTTGTKFISKFIPTQPSVKDGNGRVIGLDRLMLGKASLNYTSVGNISVYVRDLYSKREWQYDYNGRRMGSFNNRVGFSPLSVGSFSFPIRLPTQQAQFEIITDDYKPFKLRDMEWAGQFKQRGKRI